MIPLKDRLKAYTPPKLVKCARSERGAILGQFLTKLNEARVGTKYAPLTASRLASMMCHMDLREMYLFYGSCCEAKNFSSFFWFKYKDARKS